MEYGFDRSKLAYSIKEACEATSMGRTRIYALIKDGRLEVRKIGTRTLVLADSLKKLIELGD